MAAASEAYILPLPTDDPVMVEMEHHGWVSAHGGIGASTVVTLNADPPLNIVAPTITQVIIGELNWLGQNAVDNTIEIGNWRSVISSHSQEQRENKLTAQRVSAGRIELACLLYADSLGRTDPAQARDLRWIARGFGVMASFLSDGFAIDYLTQARLLMFKRDLRRLARQASETDPHAPDPHMLAGLHEAIANALDEHTNLFVERPRGNLFPWL